jgi:hypothetical protein
VKLKTDRTRVAKKLKAMNEWMRKNRTLPVDELIKRLNTSLIGYFNYYYVRLNTDAVLEFVYQVHVILLKWLKRRSQRRSLTWDGFNASWIKQKLVRPRNPKQI